MMEARRGFSRHTASVRPAVGTLQIYTVCLDQLIPANHRPDVAADDAAALRLKLLCSPVGIRVATPGSCAQRISTVLASQNARRPVETKMMRAEIAVTIGAFPELFALAVPAHLAVSSGIWWVPPSQERQEKGPHP
jgi:hypothetical protein